MVCSNVAVPPVLKSMVVPLPVTLEPFTYQVPIAVEPIFGVISAFAFF